MIKTPKDIIDEIVTHVKQCGGVANDWYFGIAETPQQRLFVDHRVSEKNDSWIFRDANTHQTARDIEKFFIHQVGMKGGPGGGSVMTKYVYAYRIAPHTNQ